MAEKKEQPFSFGEGFKSVWEHISTFFKRGYWKLGCPPIILGFIVIGIYIIIVVIPWVIIIVLMILMGILEGVTGGSGVFAAIGGVFFILFYIWMVIVILFIPVVSICLLVIFFLFVTPTLKEVSLLTEKNETVDKIKWKFWEGLYTKENWRETADFVVKFVLCQLICSFISGIVNSLCGAIPVVGWLVGLVIGPLVNGGVTAVMAFCCVYQARGGFFGGFKFAFSNWKVVLGVALSSFIIELIPILDIWTINYAIVACTIFYVNAKKQGTLSNDVELQEVFKKGSGSGKSSKV